jgi:WD40 repeat protein
MTRRWSRRGLLAAAALCIGWLPSAPAHATEVATQPGARGDPRASFVVVDVGGREVSLIDGTRFERVHGFALRDALQGDPKFSPDGRFAYFGTRDGWITRYDLLNLRVATEVRVGTMLHDIALSADGQWLIAGDQAPASLIMFDASLNRVKTWAAATRDGKTASRVAAIADAPSRQSFVVALRDVAELWLISYDPKAEDIYEGLVHDFRMGEGLPMRGFHNVKRIALGEPMLSLGFDAGEIDAIGNTPSGVQVVNLDVRRRVALLPTSGTPQPNASANFVSSGADLLAMRNLEHGAVDVFETQTWKRLKTIVTPGPGSFLRSHPASRHLWVDSSRGGSARDTLTLIDKATLQAVAEIRRPGHSLDDAEFGHDGRHVLVSQSDADGALIVYDAATLQEVKRLPMRRPSGVFGVGSRARQSAPATSRPAP